MSSYIRYHLFDCITLMIDHEQIRVETITHKDIMPYTNSESDTQMVLSNMCRKKKMASTISESKQYIRCRNA